MTVRTATDPLERATYPITTDELRAEHGDVVIEYADGSERLDDVLARTGEDEFADATAAIHAVLGSLDQNAVGRVGYSDRDPTPMGVDGPEPVSF